MTERNPEYYRMIEIFSHNNTRVYCKMPDGNEKWLAIEKPNEFQFLRGIENKDKIMGIAIDEEGNKYKVIVASCGLDKCYCAAKAIKI